MWNSLLLLMSLAIVLASCAGSRDSPVDGGMPRSQQRYVSAPHDSTRTGAKRGARFLGLLGLLTGLTLVDSLDDESDRPRRSGFVKIDVGRPSALDGFYGGFGYTGGSPYWPGGGGSSINIKIPFRPGGGGEFETMALFPFPVPYPAGTAPFGSFSSHGNPSAIEPRPSIFADPIPSGSNGSVSTKDFSETFSDEPGLGTVLADEGEPSSTRKNKASAKRGTARTKVSPPRTIRSTLRADGEEANDDDDDDDEETATTVVDETTVATVEQDQPLVSSTLVTPLVNSSDAPVEKDSLIDNTFENPEPQTVSLASIMQDVNYVTQPTPASSYPSYPNSLADVAAIELTSERANFQPSRSDHWQNYYSSVAHDRDHHHHHHRQRDFLPIAAIPVY
uniref:Uncharacterized protein n=1 Tax=Anopheles atroparvus TaxID=41427 RepID=A0A182JEM5_ANOAO